MAVINTNYKRPKPSVMSLAKVDMYAFFQKADQESVYRLMQKPRNGDFIIMCMDDLQLEPADRDLMVEVVEINSIDINLEFVNV